MDLINQPLTDKGRKTVDDLVASARFHFYKNGYNKTKIKDITNTANTSVGAFYLYFQDKYSLYKYIVEQYGLEIRSKIKARTGKTSNRREAERQGLITFIELVRENPDMYNILWESIYIDKEIFFNYYRDFAASYIRQIQRAGEQGEVTTENPEVLAYILIGAHTFLGIRYGMMQNDEDINEVADEFMNVLENGIFTKPNEKGS
ncbi:TetR/AcrR family transcriptional regulator [Fundicoccus culcitae]|uniref:TetR/AcrR family transcriptional regulator n=1 Tax=Fundicoccus culcitae TaxID=2969821 RepID=A0ABY5P896_9LACT|nr:TetR/AcrR family transcriptional regulator [Fundicoccus culcitae]UUX34976.1 TetR/AcrR family transcriptional regulator [Fundicoccus culcitae]